MFSSNQKNISSDQPPKPLRCLRVCLFRLFRCLGQPQPQDFHGLTPHLQKQARILSPIGRFAPQKLSLGIGLS